MPATVVISVDERLDIPVARMLLIFFNFADSKVNPKNGQ